MWQNICECLINSLGNKPSLEEMMRTIRTNTVCTGTQCFENEESAFGIMPLQSGHDTSTTLFFVVLMILLTFSFRCTSRNVSSDKPSAVHFIRNREDQ